MHAQSAEIEALEIEVELVPHAAQMQARGESAYVLASHSRQTELPQTQSTSTTSKTIKTSTTITKTTIKRNIRISKTIRSTTTNYYRALLGLLRINRAAQHHISECQGLAQFWVARWQHVACGGTLEAPIGNLCSSGHGLGCMRRRLDSSIARCCPLASA